MRDRAYTLVFCSLLAVASPLAGTKLQILDGRPVVDGIYVNGHGPYRFLVDTGASMNLIEMKLAQSIGLSETFQSTLTTSSGTTSVSGSRGNTVALDSAKADEQAFVFSDLKAVHHLSSSIQGVLGQVFLSRFDYLLEMRGKRMEFGKLECKGTRAPLLTLHERPALSTSLGRLVLDSGTTWMMLFGIEAAGPAAEMGTLSGSMRMGRTTKKQLVIEGRTIRHGEVLATPRKSDVSGDGLLPVSLFNAVYVCNSEGYVILD